MTCRRRCGFRAPCGLFHTPAAVESCRKTAKKRENGLRISQTAYHAVCFSTRFSTGCGKVLPSCVGNGKENVGLRRGGLPRLACSPRRCCLRRGACLSCRLPPLPLAFSAPYPPARARRALFPGGEGGAQGYFMQGALPLASPGLNPGGTGAGGVSRAGGVACLSCRLSTLTLALLLPPIPPTPFPGGEGGDFRLFYARGFAPCIPGVEPGRHWSRGRIARWRGCAFGIANSP